MACATRVEGRRRARVPRLLPQCSPADGGGVGETHRPPNAFTLPRRGVGASDGAGTLLRLPGNVTHPRKGLSVPPYYAGLMARRESEIPRTEHIGTQ